MKRKGVNLCHVLVSLSWLHVVIFLAHFFAFFLHVAFQSSLHHALLVMASCHCVLDSEIGLGHLAATKLIIMLTFQAAHTCRSTEHGERRSQPAARRQHPVRACQVWQASTASAKQSSSRAVICDGSTIARLSSMRTLCVVDLTRAVAART